MAKKRVQTNFKQPKPRYFFREWRKFRGLTQEQLAQDIGVTTPSISQLELGKQGFTDSTLLALAEALHCSPGDLLMRNPLDEDAVWSIWDNIKPERRKQALKVLETFQDEGLTEQAARRGKRQFQSHEDDEFLDNKTLGGAGQNKAAGIGGRR